MICIIIQPYFYPSDEAAKRRFCSLHCVRMQKQALGMQDALHVPAVDVFRDFFGILYDWHRTADLFPDGACL